VRSTARRALRQAGGTTADDRSKNPRGRAMLLMIEHQQRGLTASRVVMQD